MTNRENLITALEGRRPERIPYTIYDEFVLTREELEPLIEQGLCVIPYIGTFKETVDNVKHIKTEELWKGQKAEVLTMRTPVGEIRQVTAAGWPQEYFLKTPRDYQIMEYIIRNTRVESSPDAFRTAEEKLGGEGVILIWGRRSPMQTIMVDFVGLEEFAFHLAEDFQEMYSLREALEDQLVETYKVIAAGPGRYVSLLENLTSEAWGPQRFMRYHMPVYKKIIPILHEGGKKVYTHFDGRLACLAELIAKSEIDGIESFTLPPEGDLGYKEARSAWPDKFLWSNIGLCFYELPEYELRAKVREYVKAAAPDGRNLAFSISEDVPKNWKDKIPVILDELEKIRF